MIVKWIRARVDPAGSFDRAQQRWQRLAGHPGLICQGGGRSLRDARMGWALLAHGAVRSEHSVDAVVVMTWWPNRGVHDRYQHEHVADLRRQADATTDFSTVAGDLVELRPSWSIAGGGPEPP